MHRIVPYSPHPARPAAARGVFLRILGVALLALSAPWERSTTLADEIKSSAGRPRPWWDRFPRIVSISDTDAARAMHADANLCGAADDPSWGIYGQRLRLTTSGSRIRELHATGIKAMTWFEAFGTAGSCYVAQLRRDDDGSWIKYPADPTLTRVFCQHWNWQNFDGTGVVRWIGVHNYFDREDFARPYTRLHPRYGCPPMTYPDGTVASGYDGSAADPRNSRVYDAGCAKDVFGRVHVRYGFNATVNARDPKTGELHGPTAGLLKVRGGWTGVLHPGKDAACPVWIAYVRASVRQALDSGIDGLWCDNFSAWDSFGARPVTKAFGEWSVATFRTYLTEHFSAEQLRGMGISDVGRFDVRSYMIEKYRRWGGRASDRVVAELRDPFDAAHAAFRDRVWKDPRWLNDAVWRAYLIHRRQNGEHALAAYYATIKREAAAAGKPDFLVAGNDIPVISLGWVRGTLDMVSTELSWGWGLASGGRGLMPPPLGSYVPLYKLAREHARSRFVNVWMYVPRAQWHKAGIASVLYYQALANHALPMPHPNNPRTAGDRETVAAFFDFVGRAARVFGDREPVEDVGLYFSSSSQLATFTPAGTADFNNQAHMFAHWGWGTALSWLHIQYRPIPEWKLTSDALRRLKLLIIPNAEVFPPEDVPKITSWVESGGRLIVTGATGLRAGESRNFDRLDTPAFASLLRADARQTTDRPAVRIIGAGRTVWIPQAIGFDFYKSDSDRPRKLHRFREALRIAMPGAAPFTVARGETLPFAVGLTVYADPQAQRLFVDVNNTDIDVPSDTVTPTPAVTFSIARPSWLGASGVRLQALSPDGPVEVELLQAAKRHLTVRVRPIRVYASIVITPASRNASAR